MRNSVFKDSDNMPYVETQFCILSASIVPVKQDNKKFKATYQIKILYLNNFDDTLHSFNYRLHTEELAVANDVNFDLMDVRRVSIPSGKYRVELIVKDVNSHQYEVLSERISVYFPTTEICFSDVMFLENYMPANGSSLFTKGGYEVLPYAVNVFPSNKNNLIFYQEIYNAASVLKDSILFIQIQIWNHEGKALDQFTYTYKETNSEIIPILSNIDIQDLSAGQYTLNIQCHQRNTEVLATSNTFFIRTRNTVSSGTDKYMLSDIEGTFVKQLNHDSLFFWLESHTPISSSTEKESIQLMVKQNDTLGAQKFFFAFWHHIAPANEEAEWLAYKVDVDAVEYVFSTPIRHGFETDRGRVYLQYGKPDRRHVMNNEPGALPYEIWQYYRVPSGQTNVMFVFYLPGIATNDYRLIHSDVNGELRDSRWKYKIYDSMKEMSGYTNPDNTKIRDHWGKRIDQILNW